MKTKLVLVIVLLAMMNFCFPQTKPSIIIKTGVNYSTIDEDNSQDLLDHNFYYRSGFHFGIMTDIELSKKNTIETGLKYSAAGFKADVVGVIDEEELNYNVKTRLEYIILSANYLRKLQFKQSHFYVLVGGYIGIGVAGNMDFQGNYGSKRIFSSYKISWGDDANNNDFRKSDYGLNGGIGYNFHNVILELQYQYGLANISPIQENAYKNANKVLAISLGYKF